MKNQNRKIKVLYVNSCVRGGASRTQQIANAFLDELETTNPRVEITEKNLMLMNPLFLNYFSFKQREELISQGKLDHPTFDLANEFAQADAIVIAAPFWDLSFPAVLRVYIENVAVAGISLKYSENGIEGLCRAPKLMFITTRGSDFSKPPLSELEMGERYIKAICDMFGIEDFQCIAANGLDELGANPETLVQEAIKKAIEAAKSFI